ncbi:CHASE sensor domain-containing protein [Desulfobacula sp.]|uniref:CHASE sensor domain-containing protein n=1 Tax=Desulfobacula sp. TaxID=2593537 RepID=UPI00261D934B|nr:CHASE sensor domain-containing protein [Desulfobacula sp.]
MKKGCRQREQQGNDDGYLLLMRTRVEMGWTIPPLLKCSLRAKLGFLMGGVALLTLFMVSTALIVNEKYNARKNLVRELQSMADLVALNSSVAMVFHDEQAARETLASLAAKPEIMAAVLYDDTGTVYSRYSWGTIDGATVISDLRQVHTRPENTLKQVKTFGGLSYLLEGRLHVIQPVMDKGNFMGAIHLVDNMQQVKQRLNTYYQVVAAIILITLMVVAFLSSRMQTLITDPLFDVIDSMSQVIDLKNYKVRVKKPREDEFGILVDHFNKMIEEIQTRDEELNTYNADLEKMVKKRTQDLSQAPGLLQDGLATEDSPGDGRPDSTVIDPTAIQTIKALQMEGEPNILSSVITTYLTGVESKISQLRDTGSCHTLLDLQAFAHSLKSSSANVGAVVLSELCKSLEMTCRNNTLDDSDVYIKAIECEFVNVKSALEEEISRL